MNLKIVTWNVNSINARLENLLFYLEKENQTVHMNFDSNRTETNKAA